MDKILNNIIATFSSLWQMKRIGESYEIITPVSTSNNLFVSVFLTQRGDEYVVTDAGWIDSGAYDIDEISDVVYDKILAYYINCYDIKTVKYKSLVYFYKKANRVDLIPNLIFDVSAFINDLVSTSCAEISHTADKSYNIFTRKANRFLRTFVPDDNFLPKREIKRVFPALSFSAAIKCSNGISLLNFATGSCDSYYINSLCKSQASFEIVHKEDIDNYYGNRILLLDDEKKSLISDNVGVYLNYIREKKICDISMWSRREELKKTIAV